MRLPTQLYFAYNLDESIQPTPENFEPLKNHSSMGKPVGGLLTSTWTYEGETSDQLEWCKSEMPYSVEGKDWWLLTPVESRILVIDSRQDYDKAIEKYADKNGLDSRFGTFLRNLSPFDYVSMARDYDAIWLTGDAARSMHNGPFNAWDFESVWWFRWRFESVRKFDKVAQEV